MVPNHDRYRQISPNMGTSRDILLYRAKHRQIFRDLDKSGQILSNRAQSWQILSEIARCRQTCQMLRNCAKFCKILRQTMSNLAPSWRILPNRAKFCEIIANSYQLLSNRGRSCQILLYLATSFEVARYLFKTFQIRSCRILPNLVSYVESWRISPNLPKRCKIARAPGHLKSENCRRGGDFGKLLDRDYGYSGKADRDMVHFRRSRLRGIAFYRPAIPPSVLTVVIRDG